VGGVRQSYQSTGARVLGHFDDGRVAITTSDHGSGHTQLIGTHIGAGHFSDLEAGRDGATKWFRPCVDWAGLAPRVQTGNPAVQGRLHAEGDRQFLWLINPTPDPQFVQVTVDDVPLSPGETLWGNGRIDSVPGHDVVIVAVRGKV